MWLELQRASDGTSVTFDAFGFRETTALLSGQNREVSPPYPFATEIDKPRPFSVVFNRRSEVDEMLEIKKPLVFAWLAWWQEVFQREKVAVPSPAASAFLAQKGAAVFQDFSATAPFLSAAEQFVNFLPWKADGYRLTLNVRVHGESTTYAKSWFMRMTQDDVDTLKVNGVRLAQETCSQPYAALLGEYVFVYPDYRDSP
jgi:hypothetical protein